VFRSIVLIVAVALPLALAACTSDTPSSGPTRPRPTFGSTVVPVTRVARPDTVPAAATEVVETAELGFFVREPDAEPQGVDTRELTAGSCDAGVMVLETSEETIYAALPCDRFLDQAALDALLGQELAIVLEVTEPRLRVLLETRSSVPVRAVNFDLGHTLWNYSPTETAWRYNILRLHDRLARDLGVATPPPAALDRALGEAARALFRIWDERRDGYVQPPSHHMVAAALAALEVSAPEALVVELGELFFGGELDMPVVEPDTLAAIDALAGRGLVLGCVTNTITTEAGIRDALSRLGMMRYLRSVVASSAAGYRKPYPSLFERALDELDATPDVAVFVGDRLFDDIAGAQAVGMRAVLTQQYRQEPLDAIDVTPDAVIRRLAELPDAIARIEALGGRPVARQGDRVPT
jgi:putative hydrolase of the HAD superfamily